VRHVRSGEGAPVAAHRVEHRLGQGRRQLLLQERVDGLLRGLASLGQEREGRQRAERQADRALADPVVQDLGHLEAAAAHVADQAARPVEAGDHAHGGVVRLLVAREDAHVEIGLLADRGHQLAAVLRPAHRRRGQHVDARHAHGIADRAEAPERLQGSS
jgi:hypothetical protein